MPGLSVIWAPYLHFSHNPPAPSQVISRQCARNRWHIHAHNPSLLKYFELGSPKVKWNFRSCPWKTPLSFLKGVGAVSLVWKMLLIGTLWLWIRMWVGSLKTIDWDMALCRIFSNWMWVKSALGHGKLVNPGSICGRVCFWPGQMSPILGLMTVGQLQPVVDSFRGTSGKFLVVVCRSSSERGFHWHFPTFYADPRSKDTKWNRK